MGVNLSKGQRISLEKEAGGKLTKVVMGLGWDAVKTKGFFGFGSKQQEIDLDNLHRFSRPESFMAAGAVWSGPRLESGGRGSGHRGLCLGGMGSLPERRAEGGGVYRAARSSASRVRNLSDQ